MLTFKPRKQITNKTVHKIVKDIHDNAYELITKTTKKYDEKQGSIIRSPINPQLSKYLYLHSNILNKCVRALSEDIILGVINCEDEKIELFWKNNQKTLHEICKDYFTYGYSASELLFKPNTTKLVGLKQAPAATFSICKVNGYYYARQDINGEHNLFNIHGEIYPEEDPVDTKGTVLWIGGDELYDFFSVPMWYANKKALLANILIDDLDIDNLDNGNLMSGILIFSGPKQVPLPGSTKTPEEELKEDFQDIGTGLAVTYIQQGFKDQPVNVEYISLNNNNYDYLKTKYDDNEKSIFESFFMPKERLLNNETKESMNSNKSSVLWDIYLRSLKNLQTNILFYITDINQFFFKTNEELKISLPTFEDQTTTVIDNVIKLIDKGLMSRNEAIDYINSQNIDFKLERVDDVTGDLKA